MKLTNRSVEAIKSGDKDIFVWDSELRGFGLRVKKSGIKSFIVQYRNRFGQSRRVTLDRLGVIGPEAARARAKKMLARVGEGADPAEEEREDRKAPAVKDLADRYMKQHAKAKKRPASVAADEISLRLHILPALGSKPVAGLTRANVSDLHSSMAGVPIAANRALALLSKMLNLAEKWGLRPDGSNPCRHVERYRERKVERFLSIAELGSLGAELAEAERTATEPAAAIAAIRLLIFTGARLNEILGLKWEYVDFEKCRLDLPESKTGAKTIHLNAPALEVLKALHERKAGAWVIEGRDPKKRLVNLRKPWYRIRERATLQLLADHPDEKVSELVAKLRGELERQPTVTECAKAAKAAKIDLPTGLADVRLHDLRHSFASVGAASGLSLPMIGKLLGHTQAATTQRYAHLAADPVKAAADVIGERIAAAMAPKMKDNVVELKKA